VRCTEEVEAQSRSERDRWTFYETIKNGFELDLPEIFWYGEGKD
jgi:hypothetical protein